MLIDFTQVVNTIKGIPYKSEGEDTTLRHVAVEALLTPVPNETPTATEKVERFRLAQKIQGAEKTLELKIEEVAKIKDLIGKAYPTGIVGAAYELIEKPLSN